MSADLRLVQGTSPDAERWKVERLALLRHARVPARYLQPFEAPDPWPAELPPRWRGADGEPWALLFNGAPGTGKTMLAVEMLARAMWGVPERDPRKGPLAPPRQRGLFLRGREVANLGLDPDSREAYGLAFDVPVLLVDDLGRGYSAGAAVVVTDVLAHRYDRQLPTLATLNPGESLGDEATASRFLDAARIALEGEDRRGR